MSPNMRLLLAVVTAAVVITAEVVIIIYMWRTWWRTEYEAFKKWLRNKK